MVMMFRVLKALDGDGKNGPENLDSREGRGHNLIKAYTNCSSSKRAEDYISTIYHMCTHMHHLTRDASLWS
jgi:hypothetical protein